MYVCVKRELKDTDTESEKEEERESKAEHVLVSKLSV